MHPGLGRAFAAGVTGTAAMMIVSAAARTGVMAELTRLAGTVLNAPGSRANQPVGIALQLLNGGLFATIYQTLSSRVDRNLDWRSGAGIGLAHGVAAGVFLALVPALHPRVTDDVPAPGAFMLNHGAAAAVTLVTLHALYGAIVGAASPVRDLADGVRPARKEE